MGRELEETGSKGYDSLDHTVEQAGLCGVSEESFEMGESCEGER